MTRLSVLHTHHPFFISLLFPKKSLSASVRMAFTTTNKVIVIMGPTGCGKSKLSIELASRFIPSSEIINSDKIQVYNGLDITTNKIPLSERNNVPHHLLGEFESSEAHPEFTPLDFRYSASLTISRILSHHKIPLVVGGSNSFIYALLADEFDPSVDVFSESDSVFCNGLRYKCCFIWVDVSLTELNRYLVKRVDDMLELGMYDELSEYFSRSVNRRSGLNKAIGVPEFEGYFRKFRIKGNCSGDVEARTAYHQAVKAIKDNTCQLAKKQLGKILLLRDAAGWELKRVDATEAVAEAMGGAGGRRASEIWEKQVVIPSAKIVKRFLME